MTVKLILEFLVLLAALLMGARSGAVALGLLGSGEFGGAGRLDSAFHQQRFGIHWVLEGGPLQARKPNATPSTMNLAIGAATRRLAAQKHATSANQKQINKA